jgi:Recombination endonuclease VII
MGRPPTVNVAQMALDDLRAYRSAASRRWYDKHRKGRPKAIDIGEQRECLKCKELKPRTTEFFEVRTDSRAGISGVCKLCDKIRRRNWNLKDQFGGSLEEYQTIMKDAHCAICHTTKKLVLDHCHNKGHVRGVLCTQCNSVLGFAKDDTNVLQSAIEYLERTKNGL